MANLVSNALDAVSVGGRVWLEATTGEGGLEIMVRDEGEGMSEETQRQLFRPFFSTKGDLGNGLGLYISNEIVERHGGRLAVESTLGIGTTMRISLPEVAAEKLTSDSDVGLMIRTHLLLSGFYSAHHPREPRRFIACSHLLYN